MSDARRCLRCERPIDGWARICPFCNWNQARTDVPPPKTAPAAGPIPARNDDARDLKRKGAMLAGGVLLLIASFAIGMVINSDGTPKVTAEPAGSEQEKVAERPPMRADTPLVAAGAGGMDQPITSAPSTVPNGAMPTEYARTDATAVSALEYAQLEKQARAEKSQNPSFVDPRSLTGPAYAQAPTPRRRVEPAPATPGSERSSSSNAQARTRPVPEYQPLPSIRAEGTAKLTLLVGADGRVKEISIQRPLRGGNTAALVAAVQSWRFKPATAGGTPVAAPYSVDIRFNR